jgi:hypothetical protein
LINEKCLAVGYLPTGYSEAIVNKIDKSQYIESDICDEYSQARAMELYVVRKRRRISSFRALWERRAVRIKYTTDMQ